MTEFVLVGCVKGKHERTHTAGGLYKSPLFKKRRRFAQQRGDAWGILSAKYGFLRPWDVVSYYDKHINDRTPVWAAFVLEDLLPELEYHDAEQVTILAGSGYVDPLAAPLESRGYDVVDWNRGLRPGSRMSALNEAIASTKQSKITEVAD